MAIKQIEEIIIEWIRKTRKGSGLDIQTLSNKSKVPISVISKIENRNSSITILTFVALCYGLNKTPLDFFEETNLLPSARFTQFNKFDLLPKYDDEYLYLADVEGFLRGISLNELSVEEIFINLLTPAICSKEECSKEVARLQAENLIRDALQMDFNEFIALSYPKDIRIEDLLGSFDNKSIMLFQDAGAYLRSMRNKNSLSLLQLQEIVGVSKSSVSRLELGLVERAKAAELIELDRTLSTEGLLTAIYCHVAFFHSGIARNYFYHISDLPPLGFEEIEKALIDTLVKIFRWRQVFSKDTREFLSEVRKISWSSIVSGIQDYPPDENKLPLHVNPEIREHQFALALTTWYTIQTYIDALAFSVRKNVSPSPDSIPQNVIELWNYINSYFIDKPIPRQIIIELSENWTDGDYRAALRAQLKKAFAEDLNFARHVQQLLRGIYETQ